MKGRVWQVMAAALAAFLICGKASVAQTATRVTGKNSVLFADQFSGANGGAKITAAMAALPLSGGTVDACGFGAGNQTVSSTISVGTTGKKVRLRLCHETTFVPSSGSVDMFSIGPNGVVDGLTVDVSGVSYTGTVVQFAGAFTDGMRAMLNDFLIIGGGKSGTALKLASTPENPVVFASVRNGRTVGFSRGIDLDAQGTGMYVNGNAFENLEVKNAVTCVRLNAAARTQLSGNQFSNFACQYGANSVDAIVGSGAGEVSSNMFVNTNIWDYTGNYVNFGSTTQRNYFFGRAEGTLADAGIQNTFINTRGSGGVVQWSIKADDGMAMEVTTNNGIDMTDRSTGNRWKFQVSSTPGCFDFVKMGTAIAGTWCAANFELKNQLKLSSGINGDAAGYKHNRRATGCATAAAAGATCDTTVTWKTKFADSNYTPQCNGLEITSGVPADGGIVSKSPSSLVFRTVAMTAAAAQFTNISCTATHD